MVLPTLAIFAASGCSSIVQDSPLPTALTTGQSGGYQIKPNDTIEITFAQEPQLTQQVQVTWEGEIHLSYLAARGKARLHAAGKTPSELAPEINQLAKDNGLLINPLAQVRVVGYSELSFSLFGQVNQPGRFTFRPGYESRLELPEAIAMGGGLTRLARPSLVLIKRGTQIYRVNLSDMLTKPGIPGFVVLPGDVITVTERIL